MICNAFSHILNFSYNQQILNVNFLLLIVMSRNNRVTIFICLFQVSQFYPLSKMEGWSGHLDVQTDYICESTIGQPSICLKHLSLKVKKKTGSNHFWLFLKNEVYEKRFDMTKQCRLTIYCLEHDRLRTWRHYTQL